MLRYQHIVELSHVLVAGEEEYGLEYKLSSVEDVLPQYKHQEGDWYVLGEIRMSTHVGTHIEFPFHCVREGKDAAKYPIDRLIGEAVVLNFSYKKKDEEITKQDIIDLGVPIRRSDIVFLRTDMDKLWKTSQKHARPWLSIEGAQYLVDQGIKLIGTDATGIEVRNRDDQPVHKILLGNDLGLIEALVNLDQLCRQRVDVLILPLMMEGMEACPVRVIALE